MDWLYDPRHPLSLFGPQFSHLPKGEDNIYPAQLLNDTMTNERDWGYDHCLKQYDLVILKPLTLLELKKKKKRRDGIAADSTDIKRAMREYYEQHSADKYDNNDITDKFPKRHKLLKLTQEETDNLNSSVT